ncbi:MAG: FkbM family methyltransferase [Candidatus Paceibacteria bacterium]
MNRLRQKIKSLTQAQKFGTTWLDRGYIVAMLLWRPLRRRFGIKDTPCVFHITINATPLSVTLNGSHDEFLIFDEIMIRQEYNVPALKSKEVRHIIDAGANIGLVSLFYSAMYKDAVIHAYEPNPELFPRLRAQVAQCPRIVPHELALGGHSGQVQFYVNPEKSIASSLTPRPDMPLVPYEVTVAALDEVVREAGMEQIDILQFDIEGAEYEMLAHSTAAAASRVLIGEIHEDLSGHKLEDFVKLLPHHDVTVAPGRKAGRYVILGIHEG